MELLMSLGRNRYIGGRNISRENSTAGDTNIVARDSHNDYWRKVPLYDGLKSIQKSMD